MAFRKVRQRLEEAAAVTCEEEKESKELEDKQRKGDEREGDKVSCGDNGELNFIPLVIDNDTDDDDDDDDSDGGK